MRPYYGRMTGTSRQTNIIIRLLKAPGQWQWRVAAAYQITKLRVVAMQEINERDIEQRPANGSQRQTVLLSQAT